MKRSFRLIGVLLVAIAGAGLFVLKYKVEDKAEQLAALERQMTADSKAIRVLRAEWAYLNSPDYIQELSARYLSMHPPSSTQVLTDLSSLPWRLGSDPIKKPRVDFVTPMPRMKPGFTPRPLVDPVGEQTASADMLGGKTDVDVIRLLSNYAGGGNEK